MKKYLLAVLATAVIGGQGWAADLPLKAGPQAASRTCSGYVGGWGEWGWISEASGEKENSGGWGAEGRLNCWINPGLSWQLDGEVDQLLHHGAVGGNGDPGASRHTALVVAHVNVRDPLGTMGLFGGWVRPNDIDDGRYVDLAMVGVEAQLYFGMLTLYAQTGYLGFQNPSAAEHPDQATNIRFGRFVARYFVTPNDKLSGEVGYAEGELIDQPGDNIRIWNWAATYEHKFDGTPISGFIQYAGADLLSTFNSSDRIREHTVLGGLRWYFGQGTLLSNDRNGATHDTPGFIRYLPHVGIAD